MEEKKRKRERKKEKRTEKKAVTIFEFNWNSKLETYIHTFFYKTKKQKKKKKCLGEVVTWLTGCARLPSPNTDLFVCKKKKENGKAEPASTKGNIESILPKLSLTHTFFIIDLKFL